jgi:DNA-binding XRE family transcriptional regulator
VPTIRELRRERGWTQFQLALAVGVQPQTIYLWESGRRLPQVPQLRKLGEVFGLCSDEIALEFGAGPHGRPGRDQHGEVLTRGATE